MITPPQPPDPLVGRALPGGLRILERVEGSGEGALYRAQYSHTGTLVALTALRIPTPDQPSGHASLTDKHWQLLRRACGIRHPNVAELLDVGETPQGLVYAVGESLTGELLSDVLASGGALPLPQALDITLQAAAGLNAAHEAGIVHGDVSPGTILLMSREGDRRSVKLIRFDFSGYDGHSTRNSGRVADPRYASPDRRAGQPPGPLDDVYGLGAVLHHLLTGAPPDNGSASQAVPRSLRDVVDRALGSGLSRYSTPAAFAEALAGSAPMAPPVRRNRRGRWWAAAAAVVAAGLWFGWARYRAGEEDLRTEVAVRAPDSVPDSQPPFSRADSGPPREVPPTAGAAAPTVPVPAAAEAAAPPVPVPVGRDTVPGAVLSPFRRSHPWAARPDGRSYFRSSCRLALGAPELLYFKSEADAQATGRSRSTEQGCS